MSETGPQMTAALADGVAWVVPGAAYFGIGVSIDDAFQDGAYMSQPSVNATITQAPTTVEGQIALGAPGTGGALTLQFKVSSGAITTTTSIEYGTVQVPLAGPDGPLDYVPIPLYLAPTGATPIGTPASVRLTATYSAASDMPADVVQVTLNNASYPVGRPPVSIPLPVGSLVQFGVQADASLVTPVQISSLAVSLLPALT
jgi:hypothetical protein